MKLFFYITLFFLANLLPAQQENELFAEANKLYQQEKYSEALTIYNQIEAQKLASDDLYYNMANAHYKMNHVAPAIYYFEKALLLNPNNSDAKHNLEFAKRMTLDNIEALPKTLGQRFSEGFIQKMSYNIWAWLGVLFAFLAAILFLLYHFSFDSTKKKLFFVSSIVSVLLVVLAIAFAYSNLKYVKNNKYAIIFSQQADVKNEPKTTGTVDFELHEGTKVKLLESIDNWQKIKLADGKIGWVASENLKKLQ